MRTELGCAGHLSVAGSCNFRRHTQVDHYRVSTVGDYRLPGSKARETVGSGEGDYFETMVFPTSDRLAADNDGCGCREVFSWTPVETQWYVTAGEAQEGHEDAVRRWEGRSSDWGIKEASGG